MLRFSARWRPFVLVLALIGAIAACSSVPDFVPSSGPSDGGATQPTEEPAEDAGVLRDAEAEPKPKRDAAPSPDAAPEEEQDASMPPVDKDGCYVLSASSFGISSFQSGKFLELRGELGNIAGSLSIDVHDVSLAAQAYTLGAGADDPFSPSPLHLVYAEPYGQLHGYYYATAGTLTFTSVASPFDVEVAGQLASLRLVEIEQVDGGVAPKPQGRCISVASASFDTRVAVGAPCTSAMQCGMKACDPQTLTCQPPACNTPGSSSGGFSCVQQQGWGQPGALYRACSLGASPTGCASDEECIGANSGVPNPPAHCVKRGTATLDVACDRTDVLTGCAAGLLCLKYVNFQYVCGTRCDPFGASGQCPSNERCQSHYANTVCAPKPQITDNAAIDAPCTQTIPSYCADDGEVLRGACVSDTPFNPNSPRTCRKICRTAADCPTGKTCQNSMSVGYVCR
jgi:hypothetical protein